MMPPNDLAPRITLNGTWDFRLGHQDSWSEIHVPGAWETQGYDRRSDDPAHYRRQVTIPKEWAGSRIVLEFGAVSYASRVAVNGVFVGEHQCLWTPFSCDLTSAIHPGQLNLIEVEVYKPSHLPGTRYPFRKCLTGFIPDIATTFGGLWQEVSLRAYEAWFESWRLTADMDTEEIICWFHSRVESNQDLEAAVIDISVSLQGKQVVCHTVVRTPLEYQEVKCNVPQPALRRPFWREAIRIFAPHPRWDAFGADGDLRFLGISSDVSFDSARLNQIIPALNEVRPIFRRLDGRDFRVSEYLLEARLGRGILLACSLRLAGGHGRQPSGLRRNIAGQALLWTMLDYLERPL